MQCLSTVATGLSDWIYENATIDDQTGSITGIDITFTDSTAANSKANIFQIDPNEKYMILGNTSSYVLYLLYESVEGNNGKIYPKDFSYLVDGSGHNIIENIPITITFKKSTTA